jgi:DNA polymerase-3 subunit delta
MSNTLEAVLSSIGEGRIRPLYLVAGDRVLAEPAAIRVGQALAEAVGCSLEVHRRPASLASVLADLKTYSLFAPAKVVAVIESSVLADSNAAADLLDEAVEALPVGDGSVELTGAERLAAGRLLQTLRLFQIDPETGSPEAVLSQLPEWAFKGGTRYRSAHRNRPRGARQIDDIRVKLAELLEVALSSGLSGWAETDLGDLADLVERGLPEGHALVLAESVVADQHPLVEALAAQGNLTTVGRVAVAKGGGWQGLELLASELQRETGVGIASDALKELARRTIVRDASGRGSSSSVDADSTSRLAAEYRKLAMMASGDLIDRNLVQVAVEDRGDEDAWKILDAIGAGDLGDALSRLRRLLGSAEDPIAARLSFFSLMASFGRQIAAVSALLVATGMSRRETSYQRFKTQLAPLLQADSVDGMKSPVTGLHPYRLFRVYQTACRIPPSELADLPSRILQTELRLKGESSEPDAALTALVCDLARAARRA